MAYLNTKIFSHAQRVCTLYKEALKSLKSFNDDRLMYRYQAVVLRARFDENKEVRDPRVAIQILLAGEEELRNNPHPCPLQYADSPGGVAYNRHNFTPDWVLDTWHPLEKAQYPKYFAKREQRKREYIERWEKKYGKPDPEIH